MTSAYNMMISGQPYDGTDAALLAMQQLARERLAAVDAIPASDTIGRFEALKALFGSMAGPCIVRPPFTVEYGCNIHLGAWSFINVGATFMDSAPITIGDRVAIGPNVQFVTVTHPVRPEDRFTDTDPDAMPPFWVRNIAHPITVGSYAWIGAGAIIMPGVSIGAGAVVGAGSVVTKDVPDRMIVAGNPAKMLRSVDD